MSVPDDRRCTSLSKQSGERCKRAACRGATVCAIHGGKAPQVQRRAQERLDREALRDRITRGSVAQLLDELEVEAGDRHPIVVLLDAVRRAASMVTLLGVLVGELEAPQPDDGLPVGASTLWGSDHLGDGASHVLVGEYHRWVDLAARTAKTALDAGIDERHVRLAEAQAQAIAWTVKKVAGDLIEVFREEGVTIPTLVQSVVIKDQLPGILRRRLLEAGGSAPAAERPGNRS